jgi:hypothetical protein
MYRTLSTRPEDEPFVDRGVYHKIYIFKKYCSMGLKQLQARFFTTRQKKTDASTCFHFYLLLFLFVHCDKKAYLLLLLLLLYLYFYSGKQGASECSIGSLV